eukprot:520523-Alexandrium_andersonii.AAC.1
MQVKGPAAATQSLLLDIGWDPIGPNCWGDRTGAIWRFEERISGVRQLSDAVASDVLANAWLQASEFEHGKGLERGADLTVLRVRLARLAAR